MNNQTSGTMHELNIGELDQAALDAVTGGSLPLPLRAFTQSDGECQCPSGPQNGPAQLFQQILQQLTQG